MKFRTIARRAAVVASATTLLSGVVLGAPSAHADTVGAGTIVAETDVGGLHSVAASLSYDATPVPGGALIEWNCKAVAVVDPASTGLDTCTVDGFEAIGSPGYYPGAVAVAAGTRFVSDGVPVYGCVRASATFLEDLLGPLTATTKLKCEPLNLVKFNVPKIKHEG